MEDEIDLVPELPDSCDTRTPYEHRQMFKTLENPTRRKIIKFIGFQGRTKKEIMEKLAIPEEQLKFQLDFLVEKCYAEVDGENCMLNDRGLDLLKVIK
ncbi:MAG: helix-turn-helix transcriptional regulator [Candidatus Methanoperedenaceae archaeon]|nr:helix-turn-helix transcriptional regulator [Candidatus Methanoperedenaceae archaeon]